MIINQAALRELCARVASGDENARRDFDRQVPPLVEIVVSRWLSQQRHDAGLSPSSGATAVNSSPVRPLTDRAKQITRTICARMISQFTASGRYRVWPAGETVFAHGQGQTLSRPIA